MVRQHSATSPRRRAEVLVAISTGVLSLDEALSLAASDIGEDLRSLPLRDVLENLPGVDARSALARLRDFGYPDAATTRLGDVLNARNLALLADALLVDEDQTSSVDNWPFPHLVRRGPTNGVRELS